jgi:hypothetical protein
MPEVMDVQVIWQACFGQRLSPWLGEVAAPQLAALDTHEHKPSGPGAE